MAFTYFFRDMQTLDFIKEYAIPELRNRQHINVWDAGCAMGPEPYSIAIIFSESMGRFQFRNLKIYGSDIDVSDQFEKIIREGVYPDEMVKRIPPEFLKKYFSPNGAPGMFKLADEIIKSVSFQRHDLLSLEPIREGFGLIVCKNVLLHFKEEERINVIRMFHRTLSPGGFFVMEQTQKLPKAVAGLFEPVVSNAQLFRKA
ncbi:MAG: methyltransferase domain-containing protein [Candidatus Latescibacteria bacterium]|nr:methyltransferase domain-containing protein [Candidatus Latescibacterota bacterium]